MYKRLPCRSLDRILDAAGFSNFDVLFLDVEGAEAKVLQSVDASRFAMVVLEAVDAARHARDVEPQLLAKGFNTSEAMDMPQLKANAAVVEKVIAEHAPRCCMC